MIDQYGRKIDYLRISITDRCNLRCSYCMPAGIELARHSDMLTYEEILHLCEIAVSLGIVKFKITGGEPLVRKDCCTLIRKLKALPGVEQVTLTTNGLLLEEHLDELWAAGIDGINVSLDTLDAKKYAALTGSKKIDLIEILQVIKLCIKRKIPVKLNSVLLKETFEDINKLVVLAKEMPLDVRFIELMPIGVGAYMQGVPMETALKRVKEILPDLHPVNEIRGNGPAHYYDATGLQGRIGFIDAVSHTFCSECNRIRLTSTGEFKPCLCYDEGADLRTPLRSGAEDGHIRLLMEQGIQTKPRAHCFSQREAITEHKAMNRIGG